MNLFAAMCQFLAALSRIVDFFDKIVRQIVVWLLPLATLAAARQLTLVGIDR